jgi:hypothetical protein
MYFFENWTKEWRILLAQFSSTVGWCQLKILAKFYCVLKAGSLINLLYLSHPTIFHPSIATPIELNLCFPHRTLFTFALSQLWLD